MTISEDTPLALEPGGRQVISTRTTGRKSGGQWLIYLALIVAVVITLFPFFWMVTSSFKTQGEILRDPTGLFPQDPTWENYATWFTELNIQKFFFNSVFVAVVTVLGNLVFCSMVGYALAKLEFPGKRLLFALVLGTPDGARRRHLRAAVRAGQQARAGQHLPGADPAVPDRAVRGVPDAPVHARHPGRADRGGPDRRCRRVPDLRQDRHSAVRAAAGHPRRPHLPGVLEQLPLAAGGGAERGQVHPAGRPGALHTGQDATDYGLLLAGSVLVVGPIVLLFVCLQRFFTQSIAATGVK